MSNIFKTSIYKKNKIIVTDGMMGGGKTLICNLVSGIKNVEQWIYDSNIERICALNKLNRINVSVSADFIKKIYNEKYFDNFILRHTNFRDKDFSSIKNHPRSREIIKRLKRRKTKNKYDKQDIKFHKKISLGYHILSKNKKRFIKIDGSNDKNEIHNYILKKLGL